VPRPLPRFYPILDPDFLRARSFDPLEIARLLVDSGAGIVQLRHKGPYTRQAFELAEQVGGVVQAGGALYVINDRADIAAMLGADGVHVGQDDLPPEAVRRIGLDGLLLGLSTHSESQLSAGDSEPVDYLALGPIFQTGSKAKPDPVVGIAELARIRKLTTKPLVAIGGITIDQAPAVLEAGADSIALISDYLRPTPEVGIHRWVAL